VESHSLIMLSLLGKQLDIRRITSVPYDGELSGSQRERALDVIATDDQCSVILMSIMAGGVGGSICLQLVTVICDGPHTV